MAEKILIVNIAGIGDFLESVYVIKGIREKYKDAKICLVVASKVYQYAKFCPYVDEVFEVPSKKGKVGFSGLFEIFKITEKLRKFSFDLVINFYELSTFWGALKMAIFLKIIDGKINIGRDTDNRGFFYDRKLPDKTSWKYNQSYYFGKIAELLDIKIENKQVEFWHSEQEKENVFNMLNNIGIKNNDFVVGINPGSDRKTREWFPDRFAIVADYLIKNHSVKILIFGTQKEESLAKEIYDKMVEGKPYILCGKTNISELILLIKRCDLFISTNSAAMHVAGILGRPVVGLIGPGNPYRDKPSGDDRKIKLLYKKVDCGPCYSWKCKKKEKICMKDISSEEVIQAVKELIELENNKQ